MTGFDRCDHKWTVRDRNGKPLIHRCVQLSGHEGPHRCFCLKVAE
jgi:hypothetical protein